MYHSHCENLIYLKKTITILERDLKNSISKNDEIKIDIYNKLLSNIITTWAEVRILKLVNEPNSFNEIEIGFMQTRGVTLEDKWTKALKISICRSYDINYRNGNKIISNKNIRIKLDNETRERFDFLLAIIKTDLVPSIDIRNKIAHGQWKKPLNPDLRSICIRLCDAMNKENIILFQYRIKVFNILSELIHDLSVSKPTFERDFIRLYNNIRSEKGRLINRSYEKYRIHIVNKYQNCLRSKNKLNI